MKPIYTVALKDLMASVNGQEFTVKMVANVYEEFEEYDVLDLSSIEQELVKQGALNSRCIVVEAHAFGLEGAASLGQVWMTDDENVGLMIQEYDLDAEAINDLEDKIKSMATKLKKFT